MTRARQASLLIGLLLGCVIGPVGAHAGPARPSGPQDVQVTAETAERLARMDDDMQIAVFDVCVPFVRGTALAETPGYEALRRPAIAAGSFVTATGITITAQDSPAACFFSPTDVWSSRIFSFVLPLENQDQSREAGDWNPIPVRVNEAYHTLISRDGRLSITINRNYDGGSVRAFASSPEEVARHFASAWAAEFNPPGAAVRLGLEACSSFMQPWPDGDDDDTPLAEVATRGRFGNSSAPLRGNIDATLSDAPEGCAIIVEDASLKDAIETAIVAPGSGWSKVAEGEWTHTDGGRVERRTIGEALDYVVRPGDYDQHPWPADRWSSTEEPAAPARAFIDPSDNAAAASWITTCRPGTDGFRVNCKANKITDGWQISLSTGDGQVVLTLQATGCSSAPALATWWREEAGIDRGDLGALLTPALPRLEQEIRESCPGAVQAAPDIAGFPVIMMLELP